MTRKELVKMVGSEEQADYATEIVLKSLKPEFIKKAIRSELDKIDEEIQKMKDEGFICADNGTDRVNWGKPEEMNGWNLTEEHRAAYDAAKKKCFECNDLLYRRNRTNSLIAHIYRG